MKYDNNNFEYWALKVNCLVQMSFQKEMSKSFPIFRKIPSINQLVVPSKSNPKGEIPFYQEEIGMKPTILP